MGDNVLNNQVKTILEYLELSYSGAKMMDDVDCMNRLSNAIAAFNGDAKPVVHGYWIDTGDMYHDEKCSYSYWECSACHNRIAGRYGLHDYCHHCGAKMG